MAAKVPKVVIVGGGIAGLCAGAYARECGYDVELFEQHDIAGGLATSWHRGEYRFETCLHWLVGSKPGSPMNLRWREVCDVEKLKFVDPEIFVRLESEKGEALTIYTDPDRLEAELLQRAPEDAVEIRRYVSAIRRLRNFDFPMPGENWLRTFLEMFPMISRLPTFWWWSRLSLAEYSRRIKSPLFRQYMSGGASGEMSALALVFSLAWMSSHDAAYPIGGSQALIRLIVDRFRALGGHLRLEAKVERILVENGSAVGVLLQNGETVSADRVISAADGHTMIYEMLGGRFRDEKIDRLYETLDPFPSYLQVSLGVAMDLSSEPGFLTRVLDRPITVDPQTTLSDLSFRIFHYDPTFAPPGKTAVTCFVPTFNFEYWTDLRMNDLAKYHAEKHRIAEAVIAILEKRIPGLRHRIETIDVSSPASVIRYTGNWKGSMEGWLPTPKAGFRPLPRTLPGLRRFMMIGQWVQPGGGLPTGLMTARACVEAICREDGMAFTPGLPA
jgi:phytoene dehydrogenase-like protein